MPVEGRGPELGAVRKGGRDLTTDGSLRGSAGSVRKLQTVLHTKAKEEPDRRFHALVDKVWRQDFLLEAWGMVRRNGGAAGVDGVTVADVEVYGVERWVGELSRDLRDGTYEPNPVRQVLIPKKRPGKFRPLGIPCLRDRVAQTSAMLVLVPIFEADLQPEQYAYRPGRSAKDAVQRIHRLLYRGHREVVDADLSNYFGEIPHAEPMKSIARRVSDGRMLGLIKAWLEMPVMEEDGKWRHSPHEPGARGQEGDSARGSDLTVAEQHLHAAVYPWLEGAGLCPALRCGDRELCRRFLCAWEGPGGGDADGGQPAHGKTAATGLMPRRPGASDALRSLLSSLDIASTGTIARRTEAGTSARDRAGQAFRASAVGLVSKRPRRYQGWRAEEVVGRLNRMMSGWANYFTNRASQPGLRGRRCTLDPAAATVVAAKAKGEEEELRAILQHTAVPQPETPFVDAEVPSVCEGMIPTESPDAGNPHVRFEEQGLEPGLWETI